MIGAAEVREASEEMRRYKAGKALLEERIIENERWYRLKNDVIKRSGGEERSRSAWLINSVMSKHADAMDNYPEAMVLPREEGDRADAVVLSSVLPVVMEQNEYEQTYSDIWWYKLKQGTGVHGVFWNAAKENGLGDVEVRKIDLLNLYWEPGITDIQESKYLFHAALWDGDTLKEKYPKQTKSLTPANTGELASYAHENTDGWGDKEKALVIDWYYKKNGKLHLCKYTQDVVLYATENDTALKESGLYRHGLYPFVFDTLIPAEGTPAGYGLIDIMRNPQETIDKLDTLILNNAAFNAQPRYFISDQAGVNEGEFADMRKEFVHVTGAINPLHLQPITGKDLGGEVYAMRQYKIDELKETTGNRDVSNGGSQPGVTAASAIAAMQEAGSKISRDMIRGGYRAYVRVCEIVLELIREFYTMPRNFRIVGEGGKEEYIRWQNSGIAVAGTDAGFGLDEGARRPVFDIKVRAQKANPYSRISQNELAVQMYSMGLFNPQMADQALIVIDMMDFDGKDRVREKIAETAQRAMMMAAMQQQQGGMMPAGDGAAGVEQGAAPAPGPVAMPDFSQGSGEPSTVRKARERAATAASPV